MNKVLKFMILAGGLTLLQATEYRSSVYSVEMCQIKVVHIPKKNFILTAPPKMYCIDGKRFLYQSKYVQVFENGLTGGLRAAECYCKTDE